MEELLALPAYSNLRIKSWTKTVREEKEKRRWEEERGSWVEWKN